MPKFHVVPFRLGSVVPEILSAACTDFYAWLATLLLQQDCDPADCSDLVTIPLDAEAAQSSAIEHRLNEELASLSPSSELLIVELLNVQSESAPPGRVMSLLAHTLAANLEDPPPALTQAFPRVCIVLRDLPHERATYTQVLRPFTEDGRLVLLDHAGYTRPLGLLRDENLDDYRAHVARSSPDPHYLLTRKMMRRLGHFRRYRGNAHVACVRYNYDGTLCSKEIKSLIQDQIRKSYTNRVCPLLLHEDNASDWLIQPLRSLAIDGSIPLKSVTQAVSSDALQPFTRGTTPPILVLDMVDTGASLRKSINQLRSANADLHPHLVTVLTTSTTDPAAKIRGLRAANHSYEIAYFQHVQQRRRAPLDCEMCRLQLPPTSSMRRDEHHMLTAYDMWWMVLDATAMVGDAPIVLEDEPEVPTYRGPLGKVPIYSTLLEQNGPWRAYKIGYRLAALPRKLSSTALVVSPDETYSRVFTEFLRYVFGCSIVRVPRRVIDRCAEGQAAGIVADLSSSGTVPIWLRQLTEASDAEVVLMDVFKGSGKTLVGLRNLLTEFGMHIFCYFPLNDFNPATELPGAPTYALYDFQLYRQDGVPLGA